MLSAIVYGRNDGYSYEVSRRAALGLNQLAEQLTPGRDEIVYVDYNTDDDLPTHVEAIADTLTDRAVALIRVIRVRPAFHAMQPAAGPPVREAVCRNIALRRLAPGAEWVLSTNPDCLLIADGGPLLSDLVPHLAAGYFGLPRFEMPRLAWEALPRGAPAEAAAEALRMARALGLEETVRHYLPTVGYDAPGDFQLARAADLAALCGFDERMTQGWHVDSNLNARLALRHGRLTDLNAATGAALKLFHTEHARRASAKHGAGRAEDPFEDFVETVSDLAPLGQVESWGAPEQDFETFPLAAPPARGLLSALVADARAAPSADYVYGPESFDRLPRGEELDDHLFAFLFDHFAYASPVAVIGWFGDDAARAGRFAVRAQAVGLSNLVRIAAAASEIDGVLTASDILILDAGAGAAPVAEAAFAAIVRAERARRGPPRRVIGLNTPHSRFEAPFLSLIPAVMTPVATRIRFGEVAPVDPAPIDLMAVREAVDPAPDGPGYVALCRWPRLAPGAWRLDYEVDLGFAWKGRVVVDVALGGAPAGDAVLATGVPGRRRGSIKFESGAKALFGGGMECRLWSDGKTRAELVSARLVATGP